MADDDGTRPWARSKPSEEGPLQALRACIVQVRQTPRDPEARRRLRAHAAEQGLWEQLALLLADEARAAADRPEIAVAFYEELADVHENLDQPLETITAMEAVVALEPGEVAHHDRLAWLYRRAGAWAKAAESFEQVARLAHDDRARAALRAAGTLYRDHGKLDRAADVYYAIIVLKAGDSEAWRALDELLAELGRWRELAEVRGARAEQARGVEKAALLRSQARALEQAGERSAAADLVAEAARHAPDNISGLVDYAEVLARGGRGSEAAAILTTRISEAIERGAPAEDVAALRLRLATILEQHGDRTGADVVLADLLAAHPEYVPALERVAERVKEPRAHAAALMRLAAALSDDAARLRTLATAGRRYRDAGDPRAAARAFEQASELAPDDDGLRVELDGTRTSLAVERAAEELAAGDRANAERRLRTILATHPHHVAATLALADVLEPPAAAEHLRATLAEIPDSVAPEQRGRLVYRYARAVASLGDADQAHQLLHEAHRLARRDLAITLALGESCFSRKLWREAAIHLGSLADHPDAAVHAAGVAAGLVKAAQAEVRAQRPGNAEKQYLAAVRIDASCGRAWHALGELAMERGDTVRAAECLEHEAGAATDPRDRLRLFDALGDLALDVLGDPARAERCWAEVATTTAVLDKLLSVQRKRGATRERGVTCERLAELATDKHSQKELTEEAADAFAAGGELARARAAADRLMAAHPLDVDAVTCASAIAQGEPVRAAQWLKRALTAWDQAGERGEGDPRRAELWRRLGDADRARGDEPAALRAYQRAVATAPDADGALAARRALVELAATSGRDALTSRTALVEAEQDPTDVLGWARELAAAGQLDDARAAFELAAALGAPLAPSDDARLASARAMASDEAYGGSLDEADRRALVDDEADPPLAEVLELLWEAAPLLCGDAKSALASAGFPDARRVVATSDAAIVALFPQIANALGGPPTLPHTTARTSCELALVLGAPPLVVIGPRLATVRARSVGEVESSDLELRFRLGRIVELARPRRVFAAGVPVAAFIRLVEGLRHAFGRPGPFDEDIVREAERLRTTLPLLLRKKLAERLAHADVEAAAYLAACERAADRAGLLACGHVGVAIELAGGPERARHLVRLASTQRYLAARSKLRPRRAKRASEIKDTP